MCLCLVWFFVSPLLKLRVHHVASCHAIHSILHLFIINEWTLRYGTFTGGEKKNGFTFFLLLLLLHLLQLCPCVYISLLLFVLLFHKFFPSHFERIKQKQSCWKQITTANKTYNYLMWSNQNVLQFGMQKKCHLEIYFFIKQKKCNDDRNQNQISTRKRLIFMITKKIPICKCQHQRSRNINRRNVCVSAREVYLTNKLWWCQQRARSSVDDERQKRNNKTELKLCYHTLCLLD